ncbi:MAG: hypothetical protein AAGI01_18370, partial [Myxococcota bacterium]
MSGPGGRVFYGPTNEWEMDSVNNFGPSDPIRMTLLIPETGRYILRARHQSTVDDIVDFELRVRSFTLSDCVDLDFDDATPAPARARFEGAILADDYTEAYACFTYAMPTRLLAEAGYGGGGGVVLDLWNDADGLLTSTPSASRGSGLLVSPAGTDVNSLEVPAGTYLAIMRNNSGAQDTNNWFFDVQARIPAFEEVEPNDTIAQVDAVPNPLSFEDLNRGRMAAGDTDVFTATVPSDLAHDQTAVFRMRPFNLISGLNVTYSCRLLDAQGAELDRSVPAYNDCVLYGRELKSTQTYYVELRTSSPTPLSYTLENSIEHAIIEQERTPGAARANNARDDAEAPEFRNMPVAPLLANSVTGASNPDLLGTLPADGTDTDEDWYRLDLPADLGSSEFLEVRLLIEERDNLVRAPDVTLEFVDALGALGADPLLGEGRRRISGLPAGSYFVRLSRDNEDIERSLRYTLRIRRANSEVRRPAAPVAIPDNDPQGISDTVTATKPGCIIDEFSVEVDVRHQATKDLT